MTRRAGILAALGVPGLLLAGSLWLERRSPPPPAADGSDAGPSLLAGEQRRGAVLEEDRRVLIWSSAAKSWVTGAVIRRRLGLREGAAALRAIDARRPARLQPALPGGSLGRDEAEDYCRSMLGWVRGSWGPGGATRLASGSWRTRWPKASPSRGCRCRTLPSTSVCPPTCSRCPPRRRVSLSRDNRL